MVWAFFSLVFFITIVNSLIFFFTDGWLAVASFMVLCMGEFGIKLVLKAGNKKSNDAYNWNKQRQSNHFFIALSKPNYVIKLSQSGKKKSCTVIERDFFYHWTTNSFGVVAKRKKKKKEKEQKALLLLLNWKKSFF